MPTNRLYRESQHNRTVIVALISHRGAYIVIGVTHNGKRATPHRYETVRGFNAINVFIRLGSE